MQQQQSQHLMQLQQHQVQQQQQLQQPTAGAEQASQLGADRFVLALFDQRPSGYFVDVGAADGYKLSNSYLLEQRGWSGIAVDPLLRNFEQRRCRTVACPVYGQADVEVEFAVCGVDSNLSGVAQDLGCYKAQVLHTGQVVKLRTRLLSDILDEHQAPRSIEYLSLDTEGSEYQILSTFPFDRYEFGVVTVEHNFEEPKRSQIRTLLESRGYHLAAEVQWDDWYVHRDLVPKLQALQAQWQAQ